MQSDTKCDSVRGMGRHPRADAETEVWDMGQQLREC